MPLLLTKLCIDTITICKLYILLDIVCFKEPEYSTNEGTSITLGLTLSRPLPTPLTVQLEYNDIHTTISKSFVVILQFI